MAYVKGVYEKEIYVNNDNGYMVGLFRVHETDLVEYINKVITFNGIFDNLILKANYVFNGDFVYHAKYGKQFQVETYDVVIPKKEEELVQFLSSSLFPIGEKTAKLIVEKLGVKAIDIISEDPSCLKGIPRLTDLKIDRIVDSLSRYQDSSKIVLYLGKLGFSMKDSLNIIKKYNDKAKSIISDNVYSVLDDIDISFLEVDKIALVNGYDRNDERRLLALCINIMKEISFNNGSVYLDFDEIYDCIKGYCDIDIDTCLYILLKLSKLGKIKIVDDRYYLDFLYDSEVYISSRIKKLVDKPKKKNLNLDSKFNQLELVNNITYDKSQREAISKAINNNFTIITGGPGTGKTTIIKCIVKLLIETNGLKKDKIALLAPTGRAARKLMEVTSIPAYTIHKYLQWDKEKNVFEVNEYNPNRESYIIVDEASMIDTVLMANLLKGIVENAKIILVGDYYQLPSVSQGQVLKDLIDSLVLDVVKLNQIYRQNEDSYIPTLAYMIKNKEVNDTFLSKYDDYNFIVCKEEFILSSVEDIVRKALERGYSEKDIQVLAPVYKTSCGIDSLNSHLQNILNPKDKDKKEIVSGSVIYREGDKMLQLVNDNDNSISNGDIGYIKRINKSAISKSKKNEIVIDFDGNEVTYLPKDFINITHGYAMSVHKSQGGEFKMVIMPFSKSYRRMLYNKLIYTGVTRAKEKLILLGDTKSFMDGINNDYVDNRKTTLKEMLKK